MLAIVEEQAAVDFVRQDHDVAVADGASDLFDVAALENSACGILRRIEDDQPSAVVDQRGEFVDVEREITLLAELDRDGASADVVNHRLVDGETGIGIDDLIPFINQRKDRKKNNGFAAGDYDYFVAGHFSAASAANVCGEGCAEIGQAGRRAVMRPTLAQSINPGLDYIRGR